MNESEVVVGSFNLVGASQSSVEFGIYSDDASMASECYEELRRYCPELGADEAGPEVEQVASVDATNKSTEATRRGFCIGCGKDKSYHTGFPFCKSCYHESSKGADLSAFKKLVCHGCGRRSRVSRREPLCRSCS